VKALLEELESWKSSLRGERTWKRKARREKLHEMKAGGFAPEPQDEGPRNLAGLVRDLINRHYHALLRHAGRDLRHDELAGDIPRGAVGSQEIVDEVARQAENRADRKPSDMNWIVWLYHLLHEELCHQRRLFKQKRALEVSAEQSITLPEDSEDRLQPLESLVKKEMEPEIIRIEDIVPNPESASPDRAVETKELLQHLQETVRAWPRADREVFELYYVEGFEPQEVATISGRPLQKVKESIAAIQQRLREQMVQEEILV
jgi:RNA polymerase sigma factor (sigma-70 family)